MIRLVSEHGGAARPRKDAPSSSSTPRAANRKYRAFKIELEGVKPPVERTLIIPANPTFGWLHAVIQVAMGWTNSHLHQFRFGSTLISDPAFELDEDQDEKKVLDEKREKLKGHFGDDRAVLSYTYDFGDSWQHKLTISAVTEIGGGIQRQAVCIGGAGACPPEDCGGIFGYAEFLKAIRNRKHPQHRAMKDWVGGPFDPDKFSVKQTNGSLSRLPWPRVTEGALRKVLMARDGKSD